MSALNRPQFSLSDTPRGTDATNPHNPTHQHSVGAQDAPSFSGAGRLSHQNTMTLMSMINRAGRSIMLHERDMAVNILSEIINVLENKEAE